VRRVVFQKPPIWETLDAYLKVDPKILAAAFMAVLLASSFYIGNVFLVLVVAAIPFLFYAVVKNTIIVFLLWIGTTPILTNFVRINLGAGIPDITINRASALLLMVTLLFQVAVKVRQLKPFVFVEWAMISFALLALPLVFSGKDPIQAGQVVFDQIYTPFIVFFLAKNLITSKELVRPLIWTLGIVTLYCAMLGFQEHFTEYSFFTATGQLNWQQEGMADRIQGPFDSPQVLGSVMVGGVVFFFYQLFNAKNNTLRGFSLIILIIHTFVTYWTYRRSVWMGYVATVIFLGVIEKRFRKVLIGTFVAVLFFLALNWSLIETSSVFQERVANARTVNDRYVVWLTSWEIIKHFPVFGTGFGWFGFYFKKYFTFFGNTVTTSYAHGIASPHNSYIRMWVEGGPLFLALYLMILVSMVRRTYLLLREKVKHPFTGKMEVMVFVGIFLTQYLQALTTDLVFHGQYSSILIFLIAGVLYQDIPKKRVVMASSAKKKKTRTNREHHLEDRVSGTKSGTRI
jgi:O-antigen ligase